MRCFLCGSNDLNIADLGKKLIDSSNFYNQNEKPPRFSYQLTVCRKCNHVEIKSSNPCWLSTRKHTFITYNEPSDYFPLIANLIRSIDIDFSDASIHAFSYKDFNLVDYLCEEIGISSVRKGDHAQTSDLWLPTIDTQGKMSEPIALKNFLGEIELNNKRHTIVLLSRFFDHASNIQLIKTMINLTSKSVHLIFDINDYQKLFYSSTLEYLWNERRNLFVKQEIEQLVKQLGTRCLAFAYESQTTSPTIFGLISNLVTNQVEVSPNNDFKFPKPNVIEHLELLRDKWAKILPLGSKLGIIGASHKGISLAQFVLSDNVLYSLHDDKEVLMGKTPPVDPPLGFHKFSDFDFSDYSHISITTTKTIATKIVPKVRASGFNGKILNFDCQILN